MNIKITTINGKKKTYLVEADYYNEPQERTNWNNIFINIGKRARLYKKGEIKITWEEV